MPFFRRSWRWRCLACGTAGTTSNPCDVCGKPTASGADLTCDRCTSWFLDAERAWREFVELEAEMRADTNRRLTPPPAPFMPPFPLCEPNLHFWKDGAETCQCGEKLAKNYGPTQDFDWVRREILEHMVREEEAILGSESNWRALLVADGLIAP